MLRREGPELAAHEVMRHTYVDEPSRLALVSMLEEARRHIDLHAGPDRSAEIANLQREVDLRGRRHEAHLAAQRVEEAIRARQAAELSLVEASAARPRRAGLPGPLGSGARRELEAARHAAERQLVLASQAEATALRAHDAARHRVHAAEVKAERLAELRLAQEGRQQWLARHPAEARWLAQLEVQIHQRHLEDPALDRRLSRELGRDRELMRQRARVRSAGLDQLGIDNSVVERVLRQAERDRRRNLERYIRGPHRGRGIDGPSLGL